MVPAARQNVLETEHLNSAFSLLPYVLTRFGSGWTLLPAFVSHSLLSMVQILELGHLPQKRSRPCPEPQVPVWCDRPPSPPELWPAWPSGICSRAQSTLQPERFLQMSNDLHSDAYPVSTARCPPLPRTGPHAAAPGKARIGAPQAARSPSCTRPPGLHAGSLR